nr:MAG TPA: hypothetical protein [Caudoviricetes sp.]
MRPAIVDQHRLHYALLPQLIRKSLFPYCALRVNI